MKKIILVVAMIVAIGFTFTSCKNDKKEEVKAEEVKTDATKEMASNTVYQCPMDCEKGKSYTEAGQCPVCKMDLKAKKAGEVENDHDADATCTKCGKNKEECTCPKDHADVVCTKCPEGQCECPAKDNAEKERAKCGKDKECSCPKDKKA